MDEEISITGSAAKTIQRLDEGNTISSDAFEHLKSHTQDLESSLPSSHSPANNAVVDTITKQTAEVAEKLYQVYHDVSPTHSQQQQHTPSTTAAVQSISQMEQTTNRPKYVASEAWGGSLARSEATSGSNTRKSPHEPSNTP